MSSERIAFFGATGDCAGYCLANALSAGYDCIALARTPTKLTNSITSKGVSEDIVKKHLTIIEGDVKDVEAVKKALMLDGQVVDRIISGIGAAPKLQWSLFAPVTFTDPTICQVAGETILKALGELNSDKKPLFICVSTTGISGSDKPNDVPYAFRFLYHYLLWTPHEDKRALEARLATHVQQQSTSVIGGYVSVKASLLVDGESKGLAAVRQGTADEPAVGYTISRSDVGLWIFEKLIKQSCPSEWVNGSVTITY